MSGGMWDRYTPGNNDLDTFWLWLFVGGPALIALYALTRWIGWL